MFLEDMETAKYRYVERGEGVTLVVIFVGVGGDWGPRGW